MIPDCPNGHGPMRPRQHPTPTEAWLGDWADCDRCHSSHLDPSPEFRAVIRESTS